MIRRMPDMSIQLFLKLKGFALSISAANPCEAKSNQKRAALSLWRVALNPNPVLRISGHGTVLGEIVLAHGCHGPRL